MGTITLNTGTLRFSVKTCINPKFKYLYGRKFYVNVDTNKVYLNWQDLIADWNPEFAEWLKQSALDKLQEMLEE